MNTPTNPQSNAMPETSVQSQATAPAVIPAGQLLYWSVRREFWENRSLYIAPLAVAGLIVIASFFSAVAGIGQKALRLDPGQSTDKLVEPYNFAALLLMGTTMVVSIFYCLDALHGERRDRSILFWKSLPVSDLATVLSKAAIPILVLPLLTFAITIVTQWMMLLLNTAVLSASGRSPATLWNHLPMFQMSAGLFYHLLAIHGVWYAPFYGWLLLASAWARRMVFLWAALPLVAIAAFEKIAFNTTHFGVALGHRFSGGSEWTGLSMSDMPMDPLIHVARFLISPGLWIGLAVTAACLAAAVRLRRDRGPI